MCFRGRTAQLFGSVNPLPGGGAEQTLRCSPCGTFWQRQCSPAHRFIRLRRVTLGCQHHRREEEAEVASKIQ